MNNRTLFVMRKHRAEGLEDVSGVAGPPGGPPPQASPGTGKRGLGADRTVLEGTPAFPILQEGIGIIRAGRIADPNPAKPASAAG
jgi:hypothetical protein